MSADVSINDVTAASGVKATPSFSVKPLMAASMASTAAMMAFVSVIGPMAHILKLPPWQAGTVLTVGGVLWMLLSRAWGTVSDRLGRRSILLAGMIGFTLSYWAMCAWAVVALRVLPDAWLVFAGLVVTRGAVGAFYAAIPLVGQALVADNLPPAERAGTLATLGAANGAGLVLGPALAAVLTPFSLVLPLYATAIVPLAASVILWKTLPVSTLKTSASVTRVRLTDSRLRRPLTLAFVAMICVYIAQVTVGFFAIDRLGLSPDAAARTAGLALTAVGVALIAAQLVVRRLQWQPQRLARVGALISALGFGSVALAGTSIELVAGFFVAAAGMGWVFPAFAAMASNAVQPTNRGQRLAWLGPPKGWA